MRNSKASSAMVLAGAAVAASAAAAWFGTRRLRNTAPRRDTASRRDGLAIATRSDDEIEYEGNGGLFDIDPSYDRLVERDSAELPVGHSADPEIDNALSHPLDEEQTSGASLFGDPQDSPRRGRTDAALDEIWNVTPSFAEGEQTEGYDAVTPEDLGAVWLERATQTTHDERAHASDPNDIPDVEDLSFEDLSVTETSSISSLSPDERDDEIMDDDLDDDDLKTPSDQRVSQR